ncbi:MAG: hypothetical protein ACRC0L_03285, partial [Angustibacter sp.]
MSRRRGRSVLAVALALALFALTPSHASATTTNGNNTSTDVGTWFVTYNNATSWSNNFGHGFPVQYRPLDHNGQYSIADSSDPALMDFYLEQMASAGIDFIILDETNGGFPGTPYYPQNAPIINDAAMSAARIAAWNDTHSWKIKYAFAVGTYPQMCGGDAGLCAERQAASVWENFVTHPTYGGSDDYYFVDGKPLLVLYNFTSSNPQADWEGYGGSKDAGSQFTVRGANNGAAGQYGWQT